MEYHPIKFVLCAWKNDLSVFAKIKSLILIVAIPVFIVELYHAMNINNHLSANVIRKSSITFVILLTKPFYK